MEKISSDYHKFCVSVDGSSFSEFAFEFSLNELLLGNKENTNDILICTHIKTSDQNTLPFKMQAETIYSYLESKLIGSLNKDRYTIHMLDHDNKKEHPIATVYDDCLKFSYNYLIVGFQGTTKRDKKDEISKGIFYLMTKVRIPCFIIKEYIPRSKKSNESYFWLAFVDTHNGRGWKAFKSACPFISSNDTVVCTHLSGKNSEKKLIEEEFKKMCVQYKIKNYKYDDLNVDGKKSISQQIIEIVNYSEKTPDFIIIGHNTLKYTQDTLINSPTIDIMKKAYTNIVFHS